MTEIEVTYGFVELIFGTVLIYCVIGQVKTQIINVIFWWLLVFLSSKSYQALFVKVNLERSNAFKQNINPEIKLKSIVKHRVRNVLLNDGFGLGFDLRKMLTQVNTSSLTTGLGLYNESQFFTWLNFLSLELKNLFGIGWKEKRFGKKVILVWEVLSHRIQVYHKKVFSRNTWNANKVIDFLIFVHTLNQLRPLRGISPLEIPVKKRSYWIIVLWNGHSQLLGSILDDRVFGVWGLRKRILNKLMTVWLLLVWRFSSLLSFKELIKN